MDKLETFFIKTVVEAQQQARPTSGAVSTTGISDFLAAETAQENVLDKLVSTPVSRQSPPESPTTNSTDSRIETPETKPDDKLLRKLTKPDKPAQPKPVTRDRKVKTQPVKSKTPEPEQIRKSILDRLTDRSTPQNENEDNDSK